MPARLGSKQKQKTTRASNLSAFSRWSLISADLTQTHTFMMKSRAGGGCFPNLMLLFYLPSFRATEHRVVARGDEALRGFDGFFIFQEAEVFIIRVYSEFQASNLSTYLQIITVQNQMIQFESLGADSVRAECLCNEKAVTDTCLETSDEQWKLF